MIALPGCQKKSVSTILMQTRQNVFHQPWIARFYDVMSYFPLFHLVSCPSKLHQTCLFAVSFVNLFLALNDLWKAITWVPKYQSDHLDVLGPWKGSAIRQFVVRSIDVSDEEINLKGLELSWLLSKPQLRHGKGNFTAVMICYATNILLCCENLLRLSTS